MKPCITKLPRRYTVRRWQPLYAALVLMLVHAVCGAAEPIDTEFSDQVDFSRDIRPLLSNVCYTCHGPAEDERQTEMRLDTKESAFAELESGGFAIVPGNSGQSVLYQRISSDDADVQMPPPDSGKKLTEEQIVLFKKWIDQGGQWLSHWSFNAPQRPPLPEVNDVAWPRNAIDRFILARLDHEGIKPSAQADATTLIRRVTFDLTGLPPTLEEVDAFLADDSPQAYERVVDRLIESPRYGEHMARYWLDSSRYGDTHGLHLDNMRSIWPYREWVIDALNENMPFDQFTIEQLAGDLLPNPTQDQLIATGFNRCNVTTSEGGSIDEEYYVRYAVDRVATTATVWMGLTAGCAVCHEHKYDPLSQKEFYQLFAFFNSLTEKAMDGNASNPPPVIKVPTARQAERLAALQTKITASTARLDAPMPEVDAAQEVWQREWVERLRERWQVIDPSEFVSTGGASLRKLDDFSILAEGTNPKTDVYEITARTDQEGITAVRLEALTHESLPHTGPGRAENANFVLSEFEVEAVSVEDPSQTTQVKFASAHADYSQTNGEYFIAKAIDGVVDEKNGWAVDGDKKHENRTAMFVASKPFGYSGGTILRFRLRHESQFANHAIGRVRLALSTDPTLLPTRLGMWQMIGPFNAADGNEAYTKVFEPENGVDLNASYQDGALKWQAKPLLLDGQVVNLKGENAATYAYRVIHAPSPRKTEISLGSDDAIKVWLNGQVVLDKNVQRGVAADQEKITVDLKAGENRLLLKIVNYGGAYGFYFKKLADEIGAESVELAPLVTTSSGELSEEQKKKLRNYYRRNYAPAWKEIQDEIAGLRKEEEDLNKQVPTTMIMKELEERRDAFVLIRGEYDNKGEKVSPGVPAALPPLPEGAPANRLGLALWLTDPSHPLTARVTANRFWQQYFGVGIVKTAEDFGSQGDWPSHPQLLDYLATEFVESGWNVKALQRLIVTSATYRQSSRVTPESYAKDRDNVLLGRGPRFRLDAEIIRDNALALSGLLVEHRGTKSVKPYQPEGLWYAVGYTSSNTARFKQDAGDALYRRSMYTFWKRTSPPPTMTLFDAPSRESCTVRRPRTNTPLQALALMNDVQFVEAARHLARRMIIEGGQTVDERIAYGFRLATARLPDAAEIEMLRGLYESHLEEYRSNSEAAIQLLGVGDSARDETLDSSEWAAWTMLANLILNLSETVTRG